VVSYALPSTIADATIGALVVGTAATAQTVRLSGSSTGSLAKANIAVSVGGPNNCTVTAYDSVTGVATFTATPTVSGMCTLYATITAPVTGSTQTATLAFTGATGQGFFVDNTGSTYTMPSSFTYSPAAGYVDGSPTTMTITTTGASAAAAPIAVFYGASSGISTAALLTQCGSGSLASGTATVSVAVPVGTWYVYARVTSPLGAVGRIMGAAATLTSRAYVHATSIASFTPAVPVRSSETTFALTLGGYDTVGAGTASVYYSETSPDGNPTLIGTAALVSGVVSVKGTILLSTYYLYARSVSPSSVQGDLLVSALVTPRA
jgi:hypothetical protein